MDGEATFRICHCIELLSLCLYMYRGQVCSMCFVLLVSMSGCANFELPTMTKTSMNCYKYCSSRIWSLPTHSHLIKPLDWCENRPSVCNIFESAVRMSHCIHNFLAVLHWSWSLEKLLKRHRRATLWFAHRAFWAPVHISLRRCFHIHTPPH